MVGELKRKKNFMHNVSDFFDNPMVQRGFGTVGEVIGSATLPVIGRFIGKEIGENIATTLSYGTGLAGEIAAGKNIKDILSYIPNRMKDDVVNNNTMKVIRGEMNWRDAVINELEDNAMINFLSDKQHAWKDKQGNYHNEYVPGSTMVVGKWEERPNTQPRPDINSNNGIMGIGKNGEILLKGFD